ncbi:hemerythrin domain-containing protein [Nocardioides euryhalodurans]|uniref:Hemerythrin domain-containing protein n=1 Tax=Nocardioides euryhalodurans TaxID=2518370 RepID=A0A4P7GGW4_9ACTN|nr:hemerythrin domain-containing protein [Nocardioides euryhalodurans]QBR90964.1 hemerythrin domain-containing protein [Nocardioides euryhalodurans]
MKPDDQLPQVSLPGQAHVAYGPYDQTGMYVMHHALRRDLARFESAVRNTPVGDRSVWRGLSQRWDRFAEVLHHHHSVEDAAIWPLMLRRVDEAGDAAGRALLEAMEAEHEQVDPALAGCAAAFAAMAEHPCTDHRNALDVRVTAVRSVLLEHLAHEETEALPLLQRVMTPEDFAAAETAADKGYPTRLLPFILPWAMAEVPAPVVATVLRGQPGLGFVLRLLRRRFERREQKVFCHA